MEAMRSARSCQMVTLIYALALSVFFCLYTMQLI
jgi:hypothetical protein